MAAIATSAAGATAAPLQLSELDALLGATDLGLRLAGIAALSALVAALVAALYRWYARDAVGEGAPVLFGLAVAAGYLNARAALGDVVAGETAVLAPGVAAFNAAALVVALLAAPVGRRFGDHLVASAPTLSGGGEVEASVGALVATVGRATAVTLPDEIGDVEGYEPVTEAVKERFAGETFVFARRPTGEALRERLIARIEDEEPAVGAVDLAVEDSDVTYLALGARISGIGPTLGPGTAAVAVRGDPPAGAGPGDLVQLWVPSSGDRVSADGSETAAATAIEPSAADAGPVRVATAELRAVAGDVVTLALDAADATRVAGGEYRLVTLPTEPSPDREFASLLHRADETLGTVEVAAGSALAGATLGSLEATVVAVRPAGGTVSAIPSRSRAIDPGDTVFVVARRDVLRGLQLDGAAADGDVVAGDGAAGAAVDREDRDSRRPDSVDDGED